MAISDATADLALASVKYLFVVPSVNSFVVCPERVNAADSIATFLLIISVDMAVFMALFLFEISAVICEFV